MSNASARSASGALTIGLAVGDGTGPELAAVFRRAVAALAGNRGAPVTIAASPEIYATFTGQLAKCLPARDVARRAESDANAYEAFLRGLVAAGAPAVFRTAINAQTLYLVRERLAAIKVDRFPTAGGEILLVRDQTQGFYGGVNNDPDEADVIHRTCRFSRERTTLVIDHALELASQAFGGPDRIDQVVMVCKFHLLDNRFATWVSDHARKRGRPISLFQPDTTNRNLGRGLFRGRVLLIGSNEWSDIMDAELATRYTPGSHDERFTRNIYLEPALAGLVEYQTAHGSADDIAGRDLVNPTATLRAAAHLLQQHAGCDGAVDALEAALEAAVTSGCATPDRGGRAGTEEVVALVLDQLARPRTAPVAPAMSASHAPSVPPATPASRETATSGEVLVLVDLQNEYCATGGRFHRLGLVDPARTAVAAARAAALLDAARQAGVPALFVRTLYDEARLPAVVAARHREAGRATTLGAGTWETAFFGVAPRPGEPLVDKSGYDAFHTSPVLQHLTRLGARRIVVAGVFTDVCVDALVRGAFQHGYEVVVASDATLPLDRPQDECLRSLERFCGAHAAPAETLRIRWLAHAGSGRRARPPTRPPEAAAASS